jgi:hypothetical protein
MITRREILLFAATLRMSAASSEFWNRKDPSEWSADEVDRLITKSPWAKEIAGSASQSGTGAGRSRGGLSLPGIGGIGGGRRGGRPAGNGGPQYHGLVRWESAKPILEAMKTPLPGDFSNHYVISVSGIPMSSLRPATSEGGTDAEARARQREVEGVLDKLKGLTYLELKGGRSAQPGIVQETPLGIGETTTVLFGFSKALVQLSPDDQEVAFTTQMGTIPVKAKFNLKEMMYRGELAV